MSHAGGLPSGGAPLPGPLTCFGFKGTHGASDLRSLGGIVTLLQPTAGGREWEKTQGYLVGNEGLCHITKTREPGFVLYFRDSGCNIIRPVPF